MDAGRQQLRWAAGIMVVLGVGHLLVFALFSWGALTGWVDRGAWAAIPLAPTAKGNPTVETLRNQAAFWGGPGSFAVPQILLGCLVWHFAGRGVAVPAGVGWAFMAWCFVGGVLLVPSPYFAGIISGALIVLAGGKKIARRRPKQLPRRAPWWWCPDPGTSAEDIAPRNFAPVSPGQHWVRAINVNAAPEVLFAWVTQLRRAPYSYDWADNFGRRSPQTPDHTLVNVAVGDSVMTIFTVVAVVPGRSMTVSMNKGTATSLFGPMTVHYEVEPRAAASRLIVEMVVPKPPGPLGMFRRYALAWGDLFMMRKQLSELKRLTEISAAGT